MNKEELIAEISKKTKVSKKDASSIYQQLLKQLKNQ